MTRPFTLLALTVLFLLGTVTAQTQMGAWRYEESIDLFTDQDDSWAYTIVHDAPSYADGAGVTLFCGPGTFNGVVIGFFLDDYMGSGDTADVTYRVDGGTPVEMPWMLIEDTVYISPSHFGYQERVYNEWLDASLLIFRASTRLGANTYQVRIDGLREVVERLNCSPSDF